MLANILQFCKNGLKLKGRLARLDFIKYGLLVVAPPLLMREFLLPLLGETVSIIIWLPLIPYLIYAVVAFFAIHIRRFHDLGFNGWWFIAIEIISWGIFFWKSVDIRMGLWLLYSVIPGDEYENKYGAPVTSKKGEIA